MTKNAEGIVGDVTSDLTALQKEVARLAEMMSEFVQQQAQSAGQSASDAVGDAKDKITSTAADAERRVRAASGQIEASIERNPLTAVLIAFGVGTALGLLSRWRG